MCKYFGTFFHFTRRKYILLHIVYGVMGALRRYILSFVLLWGALCGAHGEYLMFTHLDSNSGLSHNQVNSITQDSEGYIWIGTRNGLARYDGYSIETYYHASDDSLSLCNNFVRKVFVDSRHRLWILTPTGVCRYRSETDDFKYYSSTGYNTDAIAETPDGRLLCGGVFLYSYDEERDDFIALPFNNGFILSMAADSKGNVYLSSNGSIYVLDPKSVLTELDAGLELVPPINSDGIIPLYIDDEDILWVGRNGAGVAKVDLSTRAVSLISDGLLPNLVVREITEDSQRRIWVGTEHGIAVLYADGTSVQLVSAPYNSFSLSDNAIYSIFCDNIGNIWIGSYFGGVDMLLGSMMKFGWYRIGDKAGELSGKVVRMMSHPTPNELWIATEDGGVNIFHLDTETFSSFSLPDMGTNVHCVYFDEQSREMWIGTFLNGLFRYNLSTHEYKRYLVSNGLDSDAIFFITAQKDGTLWVATTQGLRRYDRASDSFERVGVYALDETFCYTILVDRSDNVWVGTVNEGLFYIHKSGEIDSWAQGEGEYDVCDNYITSLYEDASGEIWVGTNTHGLQLLNPKTRATRKIGDDLLLSNSTICSITGDKDGNIWVSTSTGLYEYSPLSGTFTTYNYDDGLPVNQLNFSSSFVLDDGTMFFGSINGLISFSPSSISKENFSAPIHFRRLILNNEVVKVGDGSGALLKALDFTDCLTLKYDQSRSISIDYGVVLPTDASVAHYQVRLEGLDKRWRDVKKEHRLTLLNLQPGTYFLHIRANNKDEGWDDMPTRTLKIVILPPFYRSTIAYIIYVLLSLLILWAIIRIAYVRIRDRNALSRAEMEKKNIEQLDKAKTEFFASLSHELRTPLTLISSPLRNISREGLTSQTLLDLDTALRNADKMEEMVEQLITLNKIQSENFPFFLLKGNPMSLIKSIALPLCLHTSQKQITFNIDCEDNGEEVWFSESYVEHITTNLLSNAIKFTPIGGRIILKAYIEELEDGGTYLTIAVRDTGKGISAEEQEKIFDLYYQSSAAEDISEKGWGVGLSLVKRMCEKHKGTISVSSSLTQGSTFTARLNVSASAFEDEEKLSTAGEQGAEEKVGNSQEENGNEAIGREGFKENSLLVVDDNEEMLSFVCRCFADDYNVYSAENGVEALKVTRDYAIQLIISDIMMPEMDGIELCKAIKGNIETSHIPVILLTAKDSNEDMIKAYQCGADSFVSKPFSPQALKLQVRNFTARLASQQQTLAEDSEVELSHLSELDRQFLNNINNVVRDNLSNSDFCVEDVTRLIGISRSLLHNKMKSLVNMSIGNYIRSKRLTEARRLLREGYNVSETAYKTGFTDPNHFAKSFKKQFGVTPSEFSKKGN